MNKSDEEIKAEWQSIEERIEYALSCLLGFEKDVQVYLAKCVASLCDVAEEKMLSDCNTVYVAQARWLYWYAYRYMTNETYEKIADNTERMCGKRFTKQGVASSINKMSALIENEPVWKKRWAIIKRIIKLRDVDNDKKADNTITINIPKELREQITIKIQEK